MRRSRTLVLTSLMATGGLTLTACDAGTPANSGWLNSPPAAASSTAAAEGQTYASLQACYAGDKVPNSECDTAFAQADAQTPRFADRQTCEERYGVDQCVPRSQAGGGSVFMPLLTGFIVGQALNNFGNRGYYGAQYPRRDDGYGYGGGGGYSRRDYPGGRDYVSGRSRSEAEAPRRIQSRSSVISRGGFGGGGGRGYGG